MQERLNALETALNNERRERQFYLDHAARTTNQLSKALFTQIAAEEEEHYERLRQIHERWARDEKWPETIPLTVKNTVVGDVLKEALAQVAAQPPADVSDTEAIRIAIEFEAAGASFYARLRDQVGDPREKAFFNLLADIEHQHFVSLQDTAEFLADPAAWYRKHESSTLDGA